MSITCTVYELVPGAQATCVPGTHNSTGEGPDGLCHPCPSNFESSYSGATSVDDCFTIATNLLTASAKNNRVTAFSPGSSHHELLAEGGEVDHPSDVEVVAGDRILVSLYDRNVVVEMDMDGNYLRDFASVEKPSSVLFHPTLSRVAISSGTHESASVVFFPFDVSTRRASEQLG